MKIFRVNRIIGENFKGMKHFEIIANGNNVVARGENGTGKTTFFDAYIWSVTGKLSDGSAAEDSIKRFGENGTTPLDGGIVHAVEVEFDTGINTVTIRREFVEQYVTPSTRSIGTTKKKRGTATEVFKGHTTNFFINGVPKQKKEFDAFMETLVPIDTFNLLSMPTYFCKTMAWKKRREVLMAICGVVTDTDVINSTEELKPLTTLLGDSNIDDFIKTIKSNIKKYGDELKSIPARLDELSRQITDNEANKENLLIEIKNLQKARTELDAEIKGLQQQPSLEFSSPSAELVPINSKIKNLELNISDYTSKIDRVNKQLQALKGEYTELENSKPGICPTCGQAMPFEKFAEARNKRAQLIADEVKSLKDMRQRQTKSIEEWKLELSKLQTQAAELQKQIDATKGQEPKVDIKQEKLKTAYDKRDQLSASINDVQGTINGIERQEMIKRRIEELRTRETALNRDIAELEKQLYLAETFIRCKVKLIEQNINSKFKYVNFKMFDTQLNGGVTECCEPLIDNVPYNDGLNRGAKMKAALDILSTLSKFYDVELPIFIDDAESYTSNSMIEVKNQVFRLIAAEGVKELNITVETSQVNAAAA